MLETIDSYERFIKAFNISEKDLYDFGIKETILPPLDLVLQYWEGLKHRIFNNDVVYIRGYGRDAKGTSLYIALYKSIFKNDKIKKDATNNIVPQKLISRLTGYKRNINLFNYQVSHIFGKTKNIYMFEAPWNIALVPKIIDPFTGHETKGIWPIEYQKKFLSYASERYADFIYEYNKLITEPKITDGLASYIYNIKKEIGFTKEVLQFEKDAFNELSEIKLDQEQKLLQDKIKVLPVKKKTHIDGQELHISNPDGYSALLNLKHERNRSWVQLRKGCLDLLNMQVSFTSQSMKNTSRAFARESHKKTGLSYQEILKILDDQGLGL